MSRRDAVTRARVMADEGDRAGLVWLLAAVSLLRTGLTVLLPGAGNAAWWTLVAAALPGVAVYFAVWMALRRADCDTLPELLRRVLPGFGAVLATWLPGLLCLLDAAGSLTALTTLFTDGVGSRGTAFTLALLTAGAVALCLREPGMARGVRLLRWPMAAAVAVAAALMAPRWRVDHLFPLVGPGLHAVGAALRLGVAMTWPVLLLWCVPGGRHGRHGAGVCLPVCGAAGVLLAVALMLPQEALPVRLSVAEALMLPWRFVPPGGQLMMLCLLLTALTLAIAAAVQLGGGLLCAPWGRQPAWVPYALLTALVLTQAERQMTSAVLPDAITACAAAFGAVCVLGAALGGRRGRG